MLESLGRLGYASKAVVYGIVGILAILTVANRGGRITDTSGALRVVLTQPSGRTLLIVLACGLCGYAVWRLVDALFDPDRDGTTAGGLVVRVGNAARGVVYGALGLEAFQLVRGTAVASGDEAERWAGRLLDVPLGEVLVGIVALAIGAYGVRELIRAARGRHDHKVDWSPIPRNMRPAVQWISLFGVAVRGGLLVTLGVFLARAALTHDPNQAAGQRESLLRLGGLVEGRWFLALIAVGLTAYAVDQAVHAACRRIRPAL
jgi:hypothetical protein